MGKKTGDTRSKESKGSDPPPKEPEPAARRAESPERKADGGSKPTRAEENRYYIAFLMMRLMKKILHPTKQQPKVKHVVDIIRRLANQIADDFNAQTSRTGFVFNPKRWDFGKIPNQVLRDLCREWSTPSHVLHYLALNDPLFNSIICSTVMKYLLPLTVKRNACTLCCVRLCCCTCRVDTPVRSLTE